MHMEVIKSAVTVVTPRINVNLGEFCAHDNIPGIDFANHNNLGDYYVGNKRMYRRESTYNRKAGATETHEFGVADDIILKDNSAQELTRVRIDSTEIEFINDETGGSTSIDLQPTTPGTQYLTQDNSLNDLEGPPTAEIPLNNNKITQLADGTSETDAITLEELNADDVFTRRMERIFVESPTSFSQYTIDLSSLASQIDLLTLEIQYIIVFKTAFPTLGIEVGDCIKYSTSDTSYNRNESIGIWFKKVTASPTEILMFTNERAAHLDTTQGTPASVYIDWTDVSLDIVVKYVGLSSELGHPVILL